MQNPLFRRVQLAPVFGCSALLVAGTLMMPTSAMAQTPTGSWEQVGVYTKNNPNGIPVAEVRDGHNIFTLEGNPPRDLNWLDRPVPNWPAGSHLKMLGTQAGTATLWMRYVPGAGEAPDAAPPDKVSVLVAITGKSMAKSHQGTGDAGYTRTVSVLVAGKEGSPAAEVTDANYVSALVSTLDKHVLRQLTPQKRTDGKYYVHFPVSVVNSAQVNGPRYQADGQPLTGAEVSCGFTASMIKDDRTVKLTRNNKDRFELVDGNWVTYGHTTYSYQQTNPPHQTIGEPTSLRENRQTIRTSFSGGWTSHRFADPRGDYVYYGESNSWAPTGVESDDISSTYIMPTGHLTLGADGKWRGSSGINSGSEKHIDYYVKDGDGASAHATYVLGIHEPIELISSERALVSYITDYFKPDGTTVKVFYPDLPGGTFEATTSTSSGWTVTGTIGTELEKFKIPLGIEVGYQWTHEQGFTDVAPTPKDNQGNEIRPGNRQFMYLRVRHSYNRNHTFFWKYNEEGKERRYNQGLPGETIEVPHEAIWDVFSGDSWTWSAPRLTEEGAPQSGDPQETLPAPSFRYSKKEGDKRAKSVG